MSKLDVAPPAAPPGLGSPLNLTPTALALDAIGGLLQLAALWQGTLRKTVFPAVLIADGKNRETFRRRLLGQPAMSILMLVWKDSELVGDADIEMAEVDRIGTACTPINCLNLAKKMAAGVEDYDKQEKVIQGIVEAAEAYGLLVRETCKTRQRPLRGTEALHRLMLTLGSEARSICADVAAFAPGDR